MDPSPPQTRNARRTHESDSYLLEATSPSSLRPFIDGYIFSQMKYLTPVDFYTKIFNDILMNKDLKHGRLLGLDVYENYVSLAISDPNNLIDVPLRNLNCQDVTINYTVADIILSLIPEHNLVDIVVGTDYDLKCPFDIPALVFLDGLRRTGIFEVLKYTFWDRGLTSMHVQYILENLNQPQDMSKTIIEKCHAVSSLQSTGNCTLSLSL
ncbi:hypothetical protein Ddye_024906 [Dipteronia dyeriana]|uniref:Uncharacterized protein n=1 Tax=Dipteronia dyeriana TaxID=168575 RepID=A0AAD9WUL9_9ROSI|nr:hypothetical protein Ddye_024906 [Dipteronia dyeriana]